MIPPTKSVRPAANIAQRYFRRRVDLIDRYQIFRAPCQVDLIGADMIYPSSRPTILMVSTHCPQSCPMGLKSAAPESGRPLPKRRHESQPRLALLFDKSPRPYLQCRHFRQKRENVSIARRLSEGTPRIEPSSGVAFLLAGYALSGIFATVPKKTGPGSVVAPPEPSDATPIMRGHAMRSNVAHSAPTSKRSPSPPVAPEESGLHRVPASVRSELDDDLRSSADEEDVTPRVRLARRNADTAHETLVLIDALAHIRNALDEGEIAEVRRRVGEVERSLYNIASSALGLANDEPTSTVIALAHIVDRTGGYARPDHRDAIERADDHFAQLAAAGGAS